MKNPLFYRFAVTGTYHGSIIYARSEGDARRTFHARYNGESIVSVDKSTAYDLYGPIE